MKTKPQNRNTDSKTEAQDKNQNHKFKYKTEPGQHHKMSKTESSLDARNTKQTLNTRKYKSKTLRSIQAKSKTQNPKQKDNSSKRKNKTHDQEHRIGSWPRNRNWCKTVVSHDASYLSTWHHSQHAVNQPRFQGISCPHPLLLQGRCSIVVPGANRKYWQSTYFFGSATYWTTRTMYQGF